MQNPVTDAVKRTRSEKPTSADGIVCCDMIVFYLLRNRMLPYRVCIWSSLCSAVASRTHKRTLNIHQAGKKKKCCGAKEDDTLRFLVRSSKIRRNGTVVDTHGTVRCDNVKTFKYVIPLSSQSRINF
jgi:hypothetical protein